MLLPPPMFSQKLVIRQGQVFSVEHGEAFSNYSLALYGIYVHVSLFVFLTYDFPFPNCVSLEAILRLIFS
jgi:hypothetical protein